MIVSARTFDAEHKQVTAVYFVTADLPTSEDLARWRALAAMPGLAEAEWTGRSGESVVPK